MQAGRHALDLEAGERGQQCVTAAPVGGAGAAQVAVELPALEERRERELLEHRRAEVGQPLLLRHRRAEPRGQRRPAEPQPGRERLRDRVHVHDVLGREALEGADGMAVVAVLGVVVVLDHDRSGAARPRDERRPPRRVEHDAGRELVGGRDEHRVRRGGDERAGDDPALVDRDRHRLEPRVCDQRARAEVGRVLDADPPRAAGAQHRGRRARAPPRHRRTRRSAPAPPARRGRVPGTRRARPAAAGGRPGPGSRGRRPGPRAARAAAPPPTPRAGTAPGRACPAAGRTAAAPRPHRRRRRTRRAPRPRPAAPHRAAPPGSPRRRAARRPRRPPRARRRAGRPARGWTAAARRPPAARRAPRRAAAPRPGRAAAPSPRCERDEQLTVNWSGSSEPIVDLFAGPDAT